MVAMIKYNSRCKPILESKQSPNGALINEYRYGNIGT